MSVGSSCAGPGLMLHGVGVGMIVLLCQGKVHQDDVGTTSELFLEPFHQVRGR